MSDMSGSGSKVSRPDSEGTLGLRIVAADRSTMPRGKARVLVGGGAFVLVSSTLSAQRASQRASQVTVFAGFRDQSGTQRSWNSRLSR